MDYRDLPKKEYQFDRVVSVGMLEQVGRDNYQLFLDCVEKVLKPGGLFLLHFISALKEHPGEMCIRDSVKILVHLVTKGTMTAGVGAVANFLFGCAYVVPAGLIYRFRHKKSRVHAVAGMAAGTVLTAILACFVNAFVLLPAYGKAFGMPIETFIQMGSAVHSLSLLHI